MMRISKIIKFFAVTFILLQSSFAQSPSGFNFQGLALTADGTPVLTKKISLRLTLLESTATGTARYQELHGVNTDAYGQFSVVVGSGQPITGKFSDLQWNKFAYFLKSEIDIDGATNFVNVGTSQLMSVPYALYANTSGAASVNVDSILTELKSIKLVQKGDSILLNNNRGAVYVQKIDSLTTLAKQLAQLKSQYDGTTDSILNLLNKKYDSLAKTISNFNSAPTIPATSNTVSTIKYVSKGLDSVLMPSVYFDGFKSYITYGVNSVLGDRDANYIRGRSFTIEGWIKSYKKSDSVQFIFGSGNDYWDYSVFRVYLERSRIITRLGNNGFGYSMSTEMPSDTLWHHFAFVHDNSIPLSKLFIDGIEKVRMNSLKWKDIAAGFRSVESFGANLGAGDVAAFDFFKGNIRKVRVSKGVVYKADFNPSYKYVKEDSTLAFWELNEGAGTDIKSSDPSYNGILYNGAWQTNDVNTINNVVDVDGNVYKTVKIGNQIWMAENLKTTKYRDGSKISKISDATQWNNTTTGAFCDPGNDSINATIYGKYYNFYVLTNTQKVCPVGWRPPTIEDFQSLENYLGKDSAGYFMKSTVGWTWVNGNGNNKSGFTALPAGSRESGGGFVNQTALGFWHTSSEFSLSSMQAFVLSRETNGTIKYIRPKNDGYSLRCIKE